MSNFITLSSDYKPETCIYCFTAFALSADHYQQRRKDGKGFYCPSCGKSMVYKIGESDEQRRAREAEAKAQRAESRANRAEQRATAVNRQYKRIRDRVKNGVCPCCSRTFQNLANHMRTEHKDFGSHDLLKALREAYGLTQTALAEEIWTKPAYISLYENSKPVPARHLERIDNWLTAQTA